MDRIKRKSLTVIIAAIFAVIVGITAGRVDVKAGINIGPVVMADVSESAKASAEALGYTYVDSQETLNAEVTKQARAGELVRTYYGTYSVIWSIAATYKLDDIIARDAIESVKYQRSYNSANGYATMTVTLELRNTAYQIQQAINEVDRLAGVFNYGSTYDKVKNVHDYLCNTVTYDYSYSKYTIYDALIGHSSVCQGYADGFKAIMDKMGIPCTLREGYLSGGWGQSGPHAWNNVMIDNEWYHIDCTWDDQESYISRDYFLIGADRMNDSGATLSSVGYLKKASANDYGLPNSWQQNYGLWHYYDQDGKLCVNTWKEIGGIWYYFDSLGVMQHDCWIGDYYLMSSGKMASSQWIWSNGNYYYTDYSGQAVYGWDYIDGIWYYFDGSAAMKTGWFYDGLSWYYFEGSGAMATGWRNVDGTWYYFEGSGAMATGWKEVDGAWYYFYPSGAMASNVWEGNYYLNGNGSMAVSQWIGRYHVGADGAWDMTA